ncbi:MAG: hypothetical protein BIFFINMI_03160 [Phycisphaerae bacterium]|nr:hypothetical protein [Phycisphaerae bacterium]
MIGSRPDRPAVVGLLALAAAALCLPAGARGQDRNPVSLTANGGQQCATCHLRWTDSFTTNYQAGQLPLLIDRPDNNVVAEEDSCLGCHDGGVADSRDRVWRKHGHRTGIAVPKDMAVPEQLPLDGGKVACRTCHSAHGGGAGAGGISDIVFLRMDNSRDQLCKSCHTDAAGGKVAHSAHPMGPMPAPIPAMLADAGGRAGKDGRTLSCQTCHAPHGGGDDNLLIIDASRSTLCVACHTQMAVERWRPGISGDHPQNPPLQNRAQRDAIKAMGGRVGPDDTLVCLSCHRMHNGAAGSKMLADTLADGRFCLDCHPDRKTILASMHDLRKSAPESRNDAGRTPDQSGPCGACHSFHTYSRKPVPAPVDPTGLCTTCHRPGGAAAKFNPTFGHPTDLGGANLPAQARLPLYPDAAHAGARSIACLSCHNPHDPGNANFLRDKPDELCGRCHPGPAESLAGAHDLTAMPKAANGRGMTVEQSGRCGFCHAIHNSEGPLLWAATPGQPASPDAACTGCHSGEGVARAKPASALSHPTGPGTAGFAQVLPISVPLFDAAGHRAKDGAVACGTCHDVHGDSRARASLLRLDKGLPTSALCVQCHAEQGFMARGQHDARGGADAWKAIVKTNPKAGEDLCAACHVAHSDDKARGLWTVAGKGGGAPADAACLSCHPKQAWAQPAGELAAGTMIHPQIVQATAALKAVALPMGPDPGDGKLDIECATCHNPHATRGTADMLRTAGSLEAATLCTRCHADARAVQSGPHGAASLAAANKVKAAQPAAGQAAAVCGPCHDVHATDHSSRSKLWALGEPTKADGTPDGSPDARCLQCHGPGGSARQPAMVKHPKVYLPVGGAQGGITCATCHIPHGRTDLPVAALGDDAEARTRRESTRPMVRPDAVQDSCAICHGPDALRRFLYFHQPEKRLRMHFWASPPPKGPSQK